MLFVENAFENKMAQARNDHEKNESLHASFRLAPDALSA